MRVILFAQCLVVVLTHLCLACTVLAEDINKVAPDYSNLNYDIDKEINDINNFRAEFLSTKSAQQALDKVTEFFSSFEESRRVDAWIDSYRDFDEHFKSFGQSSFDVMERYFRSGEEVVIAASFDFRGKGRLRVPEVLADYALDFMGAVDAERTMALSHEILKGEQLGLKELLALRNLAWASGSGENQQARSEILSAIKRRLTSDAWRNSKNNDFAEAYDFFVGLESYGDIPFLLRQIENAETEQQMWPAYLAVYRLAERDSVKALGYVLEKFSALSRYPMFRADLFSLLDPSAEGSESVFQEYLKQASAEEELRKFANMIPMRNSYLDDTLLSEDLDNGQGPQKRIFRKGISEWANEEVALLEMVGRLIEQKGFDGVKMNALEAIHERMSRSVYSEDEAYSVSG